MIEEEEKKAWEKLNEDEEIKYWLKWGMPKFSDNDLTHSIHAAMAIVIGLGIIILAINVFTA